MLVQKFPLTTFQQNTRVVVCEKTATAICIDPAEKSQDVINFIKDNNYNLQAITLTHGHLDHVGGTKGMAEAFPQVEILLHKDDEDLYYGLPEQPLRMGLPKFALSSLGMDYEAPPTLTRNWVDGENYKVGKLNFRVLHCPGHTRGHVVLAEESERAVFVGDCLFEGSIGRTDLPGGDYDQLIESITTRIMTLGDDFTVYSGHGRETTIGRERFSNPFLRGGAQIGKGRFV